MGSAPSVQLQEDIDKDKQNRIRQELDLLLSRYHCNDEQEALARFEQDEMIKTKEIDNIAAMVAHPPLTSDPPLTPDDDIQYQQFLLENVPVIASVFDRPPTIDVDLAFDLRHIPRRYYKYLSIIPRYFDSLGLKVDGSVIAYSELLSRIREHTYRLSLDNSSDPVSGRADLVIRISVVNTDELRAVLELVQQIMKSNYLHIDNVGRLRDIANQIAGEDSYVIQSGPSVWDQAIAIRYQSNELYVSLNLFGRVLTGMGGCNGFCISE
jgi:Zn-dependent M16 (insulinase) family peptidase